MVLSDSRLPLCRWLKDIQTIGDFERFRQKVLCGAQQVMGPLPHRSDLPKVEFEVVEEQKKDTFTRFKIFITLPQEKDKIPAYLFIPHHARTSPAPGILALHQTIDIGKDEPAGLGGNPDLHYALELAQRGYVVLAPDYPSFGEYKPYDFSDCCYLSGTMKGIFNHMQCVDLLQSLPEVAPNKIAAIGHSLGGHNAIFVGAFDTRIKAIVSSCGWTPFHFYYGGKLDGWTSARYMPRIKTEYHLDPNKVPFDFDGLIASLAPRAFFSNSPLNDSNFDVVGVKKAAELIKQIYALHSAVDNFKIVHPDCEHAFPSTIRSEAYQFIDKIFDFHPN